MTYFPTNVLQIYKDAGCNHGYRLIECSPMDGDQKFYEVEEFNGLVQIWYSVAFFHSLRKAVQFIGQKIADSPYAIFPLGRLKMAK